MSSGRFARRVCPVCAFDNFSMRTRKLFCWRCERYYKRRVLLVEVEND